MTFFYAVGPAPCDKSEYIPDPLSAFRGRVYNNHITPDIAGRCNVRIQNPCTDALFTRNHGSEDSAMVFCLAAVNSGGGQMRGTQSAVDGGWSRTVQRVSQSMFAQRPLVACRR